MVAQATWSQRERSAWECPRRLKPSEWAAANRVLPHQVTANPGPWRNDRAPYLVGIMDAIAEPGVEEVVFVKSTQVGFSEAIRNLLGYWIDGGEPGPCLFVMPDEKSGREMVEERIRPLLTHSPALARHLSGRAWDNKQSAIHLDTMSVYVGWAGSAQSLASRPMRYVCFDEIDKYPPFAGREADPISLGTERTATYMQRRRIVKGSTPTTRNGAIWRAWEACGDRRHYHVPCPHCGRFQALTWPQVKWPRFDDSDKVSRADRIEQGKLAWYECGNPDCRGRIEDRHKQRMLLAGHWVSEVAGVRSSRVGFHLSAIYSPWRTLSAMAAQFIRAEGDPGATMNFRNSWLGEPFEVQVSKREPSKIRDKAAAAEQAGEAGRERVVPAWAVMLIATCDVQKDHCYWQVDAWGYEQKSKRVAVGIASTFEEVYHQVFAPKLPFVLQGGGAVHVEELVIDSGYRKDEVTEFARRDPRRIRMAKGLSTYFGPIAEAKVERASGVLVWNINTKQSKDTLDRLIGDPDPDRWQVYAGIPDDFAAQLTAEHKIIDPQTKREVWEKKSQGAANHWWDCSAMSCAVATARGAHMPAPTEQSPTTQRTGDGKSPLDYRGRW